MIGASTESKDKSRLEAGRKGPTPRTEAQGATVMRNVHSGADGVESRLELGQLVLG